MNGQIGGYVSGGIIDGIGWWNFRGARKSTRMIELIFFQIESNKNPVLCTLNIEKFKKEYNLFTGYELNYEKLKGQGYKLTHEKVDIK